MDLAQDVVEGLWVYFDDIIHSKKLKNVLSQGKTISLRITVAQVLASVHCLQNRFCSFTEIVVCVTPFYNAVLFNSLLFCSF